MTKVVITTVPYVDEDSPLAAPAVLKASLRSHDIECVGLDLNIEIYNKIKTHPKKHKFVDFFWDQIIHEDIVDDLISMFRFYGEELISHRPDIIGLSLFSKECQTFAAWLCAFLKQKYPDVKIIIGGPGLETLENSFFKYPDRLKRLKLIDDYIVGDAQHALVEYVKNNLNVAGINSNQWDPDPEFNDHPMPDYSDYRFFRYGNALIPIVDSRGCVQNCEFCDVIAFWKKFQFLTADNIFSQMVFHIKTYGIYRFQFSSSICNGNLREFKKLIKLISAYNNDVEENEQIHWVGSFIVRPKSNHPEELWTNIKKSNGFLLVGIESVIERVRTGLGKKFTNADLDHHLEMGRKYQVPMNLLLIAAYPTETTQEYEQSKQWFIDHQDYANNTVMQVQITLPAVLAGSVLESTIDKDRFDQTERVRVQQARDLHDVILSCGFATRPFFSD